MQSVPVLELTIQMVKGFFRTVKRKRKSGGRFAPGSLDGGLREESREAGEIAGYLKKGWTGPGREKMGPRDGESGPARRVGLAQS